MRNEWFVAVPAALILAQSGCKLIKPQPGPAASASAVAAAATSVAPPPAATESAAPQASEAASAATPPPQLGMAKRYPHQEKVSSGTVRVLEDNTKVYNETDDKTPDVALLSKDVMVYRIATYGDDWTLVEFPSGVGAVAPGWVSTKALDVKVNTTVKRDAVGQQTKTATVLAPATSSSAAATAPASSSKTAGTSTASTKTGTTTTSAKTTTASTAKTGTATTSTKH